MAIREAGGGQANPRKTCSTVAKNLAARHICPAIRTAEGPSRPSLIKDNDISSNFSKADRTNIIAFEVSKASLTVHRLPDDRQVTSPNSVTAIKRFLKTKRKGGIPFVVCEASGGYERHVLQSCVDLELPVHRAHGTRTRNFAKYPGLSAKTDQVDARMLALFAAKSEDLRLWQPPGTETAELRGLRRRRDGLAQMIRKEQNRLIRAVERSLKRHIRALTKDMNELDEQTGKLISSTPGFRSKSDLLKSVVGVGPKTAAACLAYVPELGSLTKGKAAAIVGLAPHAQDSGTLKGHRRISGGRHEVRSTRHCCRTRS
ncbi:transposase [Leisingera sp. M523]|uniref:IS110 family transposase n=1 Tax=Leisingera sp. M523 TaxID=2867013 RepID=UPI0021A68235|nr:transposase [Leisingera sp. M523]UWQ30032.1 transposase [Leisingera sp. M523]